MKSLEQLKNVIFKKIPQILAFFYIICFILLPTTTVIAGNNSSIFQENKISQQSGWFEKIGNQGLYGKGIGLNTNIATRGMAIYKNELYIGTENLNKSKFRSFFLYLISHKDNKFNLEPETYIPSGIIRRNILNKFSRLQHHCRTFCSDGGEIWKYNYTTDSWTQIIGAHSITGINAGFNYHLNCAISVLREFKGKLYAGTWSTPVGSIIDRDRKGCEVWRYDDNLWEQVVGSDAHNDYGRLSGGFGNPDNIGAWSIEEFNGYLYLGTMNWNSLKTGGCEIWRSFDGVNWERVVDNGFRLNMTEPDLDNGVTNTYAWAMKNYSGKLYVGTFNTRGLNNPNLQGSGCQLYSSSDGVIWVKESLPNGDGFGEGANWGIRNMDIYDDALYLGTATNFKSDDEGFEIWKLHVSGEQKVWTCMVGDQASTGKYSNDGFNDTDNRYVWSMATTADGLYVGTSNRNGCQVYLYNNTSGWTALVKTPDSEEPVTEEPNGFGERLNFGARSMIEYPLNSKNIFLGTFTSYWMLKEVGCEIWARYA